MRSYVKLCSKILVLAVISIVPSLANAEGLKVNRFFVLGDSLSDGGAYSNTAKFLLLSGARPSGGATPQDILAIDFYKFTENQAPFSNNWVDVVANKLGVTTGPDIVNGVPVAGGTQFFDDIDVNGGNYAQGGSRVSEASGAAAIEVGVTAIPVTTQVDRLLADVGGTFHKNDMVAILIGGNDILQGGDLNQAVVDLNTQIGRLKDAGARNIIVLTVPTGTGNPPSDTNFFNSALRTSRAGQDGLVIDFTRFVDAAIVAPERFGYTADAFTGRSCSEPGGVASLTCLVGFNTNDNGTFFRADDVHLSNQTNQNLGDIVFASIKAASQKGIVLSNTLRVMRQHNLALESRLSASAWFDAKGKRRAVGNSQAFASFEGGYFDTDKGQIDPATETTSQSLRVGGDLVVSKKTILGISLSFDHHDTEYEDKSGGYDSVSIVGTVYANVSLTESAFFNAVIGGGYVDIDTNRRFNIGPSQESYDGNTSGTYITARVGGGYAFRSGRWTLTPGIAYTYERLDLNGYSESPGVASLAYGDNELESSRVSASLTFSFKPSNPNGWYSTLRVSVEHEFEDSDFKVRLGPDADIIGALYLERPEETYGYVSGSLSKKIDDNATLSINASTIVGQEGVTGVTGGVSIKTKF